MSLARAYEDPHERRVLGGVEPFAKAHELKTPQAQRIPYVHVLQPLIKTNNQSYHQSIGMPPQQVTANSVPEVWDALYGRRFEQKTTPPNVKSGIACNSTNIVH